MNVNTKQIPVLIDFAPGSEFEACETLPSESEALPKTAIRLASGETVELPTEQIILKDESAGTARVGLGGMSFEGMERDQLVFWRVRDLLPEEKLSSSFDYKLLLDPAKVARVTIQGTQVWPSV